MTRNKLEVLAKLGDATAPITRPRIRLAYQLTPQRVLGETRATGIEFEVTGSGARCELPATLVLTSIGYRGQPIAGLPFDHEAAVVPNDAGRVMGDGAPVPGAYVAGWIKRGPSGFIGTNKSCAAETVHTLVADYNDGRLADPAQKPSALERFVRAKAPRVIDAAGWKAIDEAEIERGGGVRPRDKFTTVAAMQEAAESATAPPLHRRLLAGLRR